MVNIRISGQTVALALCISLAGFAAGHLLRHGRVLDASLAFALTCVASLVAGALSRRATLPVDDGTDRSADA